ncbi:hypothetical protein VNI00_006922 [Paramarasmius palmivorus]|uniref:Uncharacterized protein n=1 Tax=Paramarasmius palmivorus TaxID=297713 RepID=A0AAW0D851_9AGAR
MARRAAFKGSRLEFLTTHLDEYRKAADEGCDSEVIADITRRYLKRYPETLEHNVEPSSEHLATVNDDVADAELVPPVRKEGQSDQDFEKALAEYDAMKKRVAFRMEQIARWFDYRRVPRRDAQRNLGAINRVVGKLVGAPSGPGRKLAAFVVWAQANPDIVEPLVRQRLLELEREEEKLLEEATAKGLQISGETSTQANTQAKEGLADGGSDTSSSKANDGKDKEVDKKPKFVKKGNRAFLAVRQEVIKTAFEKLPPDERKKWADQAREQHHEREQRYNQAMRSPPPTDPVSRQSNHYGVTSGPAKLTFGAAARVSYKRYVIPLYAHFLQKVYSKCGHSVMQVTWIEKAIGVEECRRRALPAGTPSLASIIEEEADDISVEPVILPPKLPEGPLRPEPQQGLQSQTGMADPPKRMTVSAAAAFGINPTKPAGKSQAPGSSSLSSTSLQRSQPQKTLVKTTARMKPGPAPPVPTSRPSTQPRTSSSSDKPSAPIPKDKSARYRLAGSSRNDKDPQPSGSSSLQQSSAPPPREQSARYRLAGSGRDDTSAQSSAGVAGAPRRRAVSSPPSPVRMPQSSPATVVPTPPRNTHSPDPCSPITVPSSPPQAPTVTASGRAHSPIVVPSSPQLPATGSGRQVSPGLVDLDQPSPVVIRTYRSPSRKRRNSATAMSPIKRFKVVQEGESDGDVEVVKEPAASSSKGKAASSSSRKRKAENSADSKTVTASGSHQHTATKQGSRASAAGAPSMSISAGPLARPSKKARHNETVSAPAPTQPSSSALVTPTTWTIDTPPSAPDYVQKILTLARAVGIDEDFRRMLRLFLRIEEAANWSGTARLSSYRRPDAVYDWINRARSPKWRPILGDLGDFNDEFIIWFRGCMPEWRKDEGRGIRLTRDPNGDWEDLRITGQNGIVSFIAPLAWWKEAVAKLPSDTVRQRQVKTLRQGEYEGALAEVIYCFTGLAKGL